MKSRLNVGRITWLAVTETQCFSSFHDLLYAGLSPIHFYHSKIKYKLQQLPVFVLSISDHFCKTLYFCYKCKARQGCIGQLSFSHMGPVIITVSDALKQNQKILT